MALIFWFNYFMYCTPYKKYCLYSVSEKVNRLEFEADNSGIEKSKII